MKDSYYFRHDYNARGDDRIVPMLKDLGWVGYGLYWALVEKMYESGGLIRADFETLAFDLRTEKPILEKLTKKYGLFYFNHGKVGSKTVNKRMQERAEKSEKARNSVSLRRDREVTNVQRTYNERTTKKGEERRGEERKEKKGEETRALETDPSFCQFKENGILVCDIICHPNSHFCEHHKFKVRDKFLSKGSERSSEPRRAGEIAQEIK